ncbi:hypothetical protein [Vibrio cyclitrophicus]|uniref:hypothetical protein n=1 Tax=Vibrio cyclitrophicus TaxID=47951 RepID=UPI0011B6F131|nr:hypothetical protein [Vibrio cyclitrophicus]
MLKNPDELTPTQFVQSYQANVQLVLSELKELVDLVKGSENFDELRDILPKIFETNSKITKLRKECTQHSKLIAIHTDERNKSLFRSKNQLEKATALYFESKSSLSSKESELKKLASVLITATIMLPFILSSTLDVWVKLGYPVLLAVIIKNIYGEYKIKKSRAKELQNIKDIMRDISVSQRDYASFVYANTDSSLDLIDQLFESINDLEDISLTVEQAVSEILESGVDHD